MTGKNKKDLQVENCKLKEEVSDLKIKHETLQENVDIFQKKTESNYKCNKCERSKETIHAHKETHEMSNEKLQCDVYGKVVNKEWKISAHRKIHADYGCSVCEKTFKYQEIKSKHMRIAHENLKLFCHFFNNNKTCPYSKDCIFLHQASPICKYGKKCERLLCMFKHETDEVENVDTFAVIVDVDEVDEIDESNENSVDINEENDDQESVKIDDPNDNADIIETVAIVETVRYDDITIIETVNDKEVNVVEKVTNKTPTLKRRKCLMCDYEAETGSEVRDHKKLTHNWCCLCFSNFKNKDLLKKHIEDQHKVEI